MLRYFAAVWESSDAGGRATVSAICDRLKLLHPSWQPIFDAPGLSVQVLKPRAHEGSVIRLSNQTGIVLGKLFRADSSGDSSLRCHDLDCRQTRRLLQSRGRSLISDFWGSYVAFLRPGPDGQILLLRSPMGNLPVFCAAHQRVQLYFSCVEDCVGLRLLRFSINWDCVRAQAANGDYLTSQTAINEIATLECGECLEIHGQRQRRLVYWSPCEVARSKHIDDFTQAAQALRSSTQLSIDGWAEGHNRILHSLSGGLDSSIVLACLTRTPTAPLITCVTAYSRHAVGDERRFARSMAERAGVELVERQRIAEIDLHAVLDCALTATPVLSFTALDSYPAHVALANRVGATAIFNGELGDNVFGSTIGHEAVTEHLQRHGVTRQLFDVAEDSARIRQSTIWKAIYDGARDRLSRSRAAYWSAYLDGRRLVQRDTANRGLVKQEVLEEYERTIWKFIHPWFRDVANVPLGKFQLIFALYTITSATYHPPFAKDDDPVIVTPLASQPLVDVALAIATHLNIASGHDRAVARHAFAAGLSELVVNRRGKGHPGFWIRDLIAHNRRVLHEILCDGILVKEGILDRRKLEDVLSGTVTKSNVSIYDTIVQLYIEAWLRRWRDITNPCSGYVPAHPEPLRLA